jgi:hypothetical protein
VTAPTFNVTGTRQVIERNNDGADVYGEITHISASAIVDTPEQAKSFAASLPKSLKVRGWNFRVGTEDKGYIAIEATFGKEKTQGEKNETGTKRLQKFLSRVPYTVGTAYAKNAATPDEIRQFLSI